MRPALKVELRPRRREISLRFARGETADAIVEWLQVNEVKCEVEDLEFFKGQVQQATIVALREKLSKSLPINDNNWCLLKLNEIAEHSKSPNEVLSAIRTSRQIIKGEGEASPMDWQGEQ